MEEPPAPNVTELLEGLSAGKAHALEDLMTLVHRELRRQAAGYLRRERPNHTLQPTALVNEAFLKLVEQRNMRWQNRAHFFGVAAQAMRRILVDHARTQSASSAAASMPKVTLDEGMIATESRSIDLLALDEALQRLSGSTSARPRRRAQILRRAERRRDGGGAKISPATVKREWSMAKAWLHLQLSQ